jgi:hypothetical protein
MEAREIMVPIKESELKSILTLFKRDKSLGPNGWTVEFYFHFFDLIKEDLLAPVESVRTGGCLVGSLNSTFIALIPELNKPLSFGDYRPISLCNLIYKIISKVIANCIKLFLSRALLPEQFEFLEGHEIHDAIGTTHECINSIKKKHKKYLILKLNIQKAYNCVN